MDKIIFQQIKSSREHLIFVEPIVKQYNDHHANNHRKFAAKTC
jgi:hypothetical protein